MYCEREVQTSLAGMPFSLFVHLLCVTQINQPVPTLMKRRNRLYESCNIKSEGRKCCTLHSSVSVTATVFFYWASVKYTVQAVNTLAPVQRFSLGFAAQ